jgi:hypothetical protein
MRFDTLQNKLSWTNVVPTLSNNACLLKALFIFHFGLFFDICVISLPTDHYITDKSTTPIAIFIAGI